MSKVFISYAHQEPDRQLALEIVGVLESNGFDVFVDSKILIGQDWVEQIDLQLRASDYFVVVLSSRSVLSDMVRREIAVAYKLRKARQLVILPVRIGSLGELPYDLGAYLDLIQYISWNPGEPTLPICNAILSSIQSPTRPSAVLPAPSHQTSRPRFDAEELQSVTRELARYLGPVAPVLVARAAKKSDTWSGLYDLLAAQIPTAEERKRFLAVRRT